MDTSGKSFGARLASFYASPFQGADMDALDWILLEGLLLVGLIFWAYILNHIREAAT